MMRSKNLFALMIVLLAMHASAQVIKTVKITQTHLTPKQVEVAAANQEQFNKCVELIERADLQQFKLACSKMNLNTQGPQKMTLLMETIVNNEETIFDFLLKQKVNLEIKNEVGDTALAMAVGNDKLAMADKLIRANARLDVSCGSEDETLLMCATRINAANIVKTILRRAPEVRHKKNRKGQTAADIAHLTGTEAIRKIFRDLK